MQEPAEVAGISKIYQAMEKLAGMGLAEIQATRPKQYSAMTESPRIANA